MRARLNAEPCKDKFDGLPCGFHWIRSSSTFVRCGVEHAGNRSATVSAWRVVGSCHLTTAGRVRWQLVYTVYRLPSCHGCWNLYGEYTETCHGILRTGGPDWPGSNWGPPGGLRGRVWCWTTTTEEASGTRWVRGRYSSCLCTMRWNPPGDLAPEAGRRTPGTPLLTWHDDVMKWKHFPRCWPFVRGIHRSPVNSPHKGQWRGALIFRWSAPWSWINGWVNIREAGDLRRHRAHYDVIIMLNSITVWISNHICSFQLCVITHPWLNINGGLAKPPLKLRHGWVNTFHTFVLMWFVIHAGNHNAGLADMC